MTSVNTKIADAAIGHQVDLLRVEAGLRRDVLTLMQTLSGDLAATLAKAGEWDVESIPRKLKRLQGLKGQTDGLIGDLYAKLESDTLTEMKDAATYAAQWAPQAINAAVGVDIASITLTPQLLNNLVKNTLVEGAPSSQWWSRQSDSLKMDFSREMRMGILQGENLGDLTRRIRGRKENGYADGLLPPAADAAGKISRQASTKATRAAEGLALTSVQQVMSDARMEAYQQNADIIKGVQQLSTLDGRTSATCRGLDHAARALDGSPLPGLPLLPSGGPPWHWRCRSVLIPLTKSWAELGIKGQKEIPPGTRASMDGQVPDSMDYGTWLKGKPEAFQKEVLGKGRFELWRDGKADLKDMVDQRGRPVKVRELVQIEPKIPATANIMPAYQFTQSTQELNRLFTNAFTGAPDTYQQIVSNAAKDLTITEVQRSKDIGYLYRTISASTKMSLEDIRHEYGHYVSDYPLNNGGDSLCHTAKFSGTMLKEAKTLSSLPKPQKESIINALISDTFSQEYSLSDLFSAVSNTKVEGNGGHSLGYFARPGNRQEEAFANLFAIFSADKNEVIAFARLHLPDLTAAFEEIIKELA